MNSYEIFDYWNNKAKILKTDPSVTMKDIILRTMEIEAIGERLKPDDMLLDVGTGNAFGALQWAKSCKKVLAVDFSKKMIEAANDAISLSGCSNIQAEVANILDLNKYLGQFNAASCVRCLINLNNEEEWKFALSQLAKTLVYGGRLFLIEGFVETFDSINVMRKKVQLPSIELHWHNHLLPRRKLERALSKLFTIEERVDFGEYYFISRIIHPLFVAPNEPSFESKLNHIAKDIWKTGIIRGLFDFASPLLLYVCHRR